MAIAQLLSRSSGYPTYADQSRSGWTASNEFVIPKTNDVSIECLVNRFRYSPSTKSYPSSGYGGSALFEDA